MPDAVNPAAVENSASIRSLNMSRPRVSFASRMQAACPRRGRLRPETGRKRRGPFARQSAEPAVRVLMRDRDTQIADGAAVQARPEGVAVKQGEHDGEADGGLEEL